MKRFERMEYKNYIVDVDNLGRMYIYGKDSPYSEDSDRKYISYEKSMKKIKEIIDETIRRKEIMNSGRG